MILISFLVRFILILFTLSFSPFTHAACVVVDDQQVKIHLSKPAQRIISLAPDITETLFAIGADQHVVGVVKGSDYPAKAQALTQVGSYTGIDLEKVMALHPDLIITWRHGFTRQLAVLKKWGIPIYTTEPRRLEDIPRTIKNLGCLTGTASQADQLAKSFTQDLQQLHEKYAKAKTMTVFYQIGAYSFITINQDSWINQAITLCGGRNIFANSRAIAPEVSIEAIVVENPEVIVSDAMQSNWQAHWRRLPSIAAVKNQQLYRIHPDLIERAGPRLLEGVKAMCVYLDSARSAKNQALSLFVE